MMEQNNQMMINMNQMMYPNDPMMMNMYQMMYQNNPMMMNMYQIMDQNNPMMMNMNINAAQNLDPAMVNNIDQNIPYLNNFEENHQESNCKFVKVFCDGEFIGKVPIYNSDNYSDLRSKLIGILYSFGKVVYRPAFENDVIERTCPNETLEYLIERGVVDNNPCIIIYNQFRMHNYYTDNNIRDIQNGDILNVSFEGRIYGAGPLGGIEFIDVDSLTKTKKLQIVKDPPKWRLISVGLNLFGKCKNKKCKVFNKEVAYSVGINQKFDFNEKIENIRCPICSKNFLPVTMGFYKCEYQIKGKKFKDGEYEIIDINGKETNGDDFEYFDPYKNKSTSWPSLQVFTGHRQKMKYSKTV